MSSSPTRKQAKEAGLQRYTNCKPCPKCGAQERYTSTGQCVPCHNIYSAQQAKNNRVIIRQQARKRWAANPKIRQRNLEWQRNNREKCKQSTRNWVKNNLPKLLAKANKRRAIKLNACPSWACQDCLDAVYKEAADKTAAEGVQYHVDHIVPLNNPVVCGLHVPWNLQIITAEENIRKGNSFELNGVIYATKGGRPPSNV